MNAIKLLEQLRKYPVFGAEEAARILNCDKRYANLVLTRLRKKKAIKRVDFGKYTLSNLAQTIATYLVTPSYITGWYALRYYDLTEQLPQQIDVLTTKKKNKKILSFNNEKVRYLNVDKKYLFEFFSEVSEQYTMNIASSNKREARSFVRLNVASIRITFLAKEFQRLYSLSTICRFGSGYLKRNKTFKECISLNLLYVGTKI